MNGHAATGFITSFALSAEGEDDAADYGAMDESAGGLLKMTSVSQWATGGTDSCYLEMDKRERFCFVSNYTSGSVTVFPVRSDRSLGPPCCFRQHKPYEPEQSLPGPVNDRQEGPHAHQARLMEERPRPPGASLHRNA